jgi:hypothetical protein
MTYSEPDFDSTRHGTLPVRLVVAGCNDTQTGQKDPGKYHQDSYKIIQISKIIRSVTKLSNYLKILWIAILHINCLNSSGVVHNHQTV